MSEIALLLSLSDKTVIERIKSGALGKDVVNLGSEIRPDYRAPASGVNAYLESRRLFSETTEPGVAARSIGELRRKLIAA